MIKFLSRTPMFSGAECAAADCATMAKPCASYREVFGVRLERLVSVFQL